MLTVKDVASILGLTPRMVQKHAQAGTIKAIKISKIYFFNESEVERARNRRKPGRPSSGRDDALD